MPPPRYGLAIDGELGPRYASAFDEITLRPHSGGWEPRGQGSHSTAWAARPCSQPSGYPESGEDGDTDRVQLRRDFSNGTRLMPTCLEASS
jgi:hypothetical protein